MHLTRFKTESNYARNFFFHAHTILKLSKWASDDNTAYKQQPFLDSLETL